MADIERDVLDRLRGAVTDGAPNHALLTAAADEIERLRAGGGVIKIELERDQARAEVERLREVLETIVTVPSGWDGVERIREHARRALTPEDKDKEEKDKEERRLSFAVSARRPFWCSFWSADPSKWEYHGPWWISGYRYEDAEQSSIVAAVMATDENDAKRILTAAHDKGHEPVEWRFHREMEPWETPFSARFRRDHWMNWPWPKEQGG